MGGTSPARKEAKPDLKEVKPATVHRVTAADMAKNLRVISGSEFFATNRQASPRAAGAWAPRWS